uniref:meiosis inhibitor protein 1-like isoform X4 n=1 Tax=Oncorhynchus gorbuscha TaxID=8017 RepID=UPI001EAED47A|nr:meiosis inhibitor protein 1-like isoform X4 [Oncorhynchus gorbuscha]
MTSVDVIYEKIHFRHDPKWSVRVRMGHPDQGSLLICVACVIEMMESNNVASVRKSVALSGISGILKSCPGALKELLLQDHRVCLHFTASLLGMLHTVEDPATLEQAIQVLVQLLLELQSEQYVCYILDEIDTQLCDQSSVRGFLPTFTFLGKLVDAVPSLPQSLASSHVSLLERLCSTLLYPDEGLKASVFYVWQRVWGAGGAAQSLPSPLRDRVCVLLMQTLSHACSSQLTINCLGFLKQLLKLGEVVSVLMNSPCEQIRSDLDQSLDLDQEAQSSTQLSLERCSLPLILKKLLLCGDETLQVASAQCMAAILVHSPSQYCASFIQADVPEFLFERLNSGSEVLLWSVYSCLLLLTEDPLFFSQCHSVYGIESLVRSLKEALRLTNVEVQRQGLLLLTEILERQPAGVRLFPSAPGFVAVAEAVLSGVCSPSLQVATQAAHAATALLRVNHQSSPVQYKQLEKLVEDIIARCTELPLPASSRCRVSLRGDEPSSQASRAGGFLLQALVCFHAACRLVEQCSSEPGLKENVFTAPSKQVQGQDPLESLCLCLLHCCDTVCIPTVTRHCELAPSAQVLQHFFSILSYQFSLLPSLMPLFAAKLASSGFFRLALEHKAVLCAGNRNPALNAACCGFLQRLSVSLLSQPDPAASILPQDCEEIEAVLRSSLPSLCCRVCEWPSLLCESPGPQCDPAGPRATQYCLLTLLHLALQHGDRLLPDSTVFSCVVTLLCSVQEQGDSALPPCVLRSALYLLSVTQDKSPDLDWAPLNCISKALSSSPSFASLYTHHPPLLHFLFRYPELAEHFGPRVLELWLSHRAQATPQSDTNSKKTEGPSEQNQDPDNTALLTLLEKSPTVILNLLGMVCTREAPLAERAVEVLGSFLQGRRGCKAGLCTLLRPTLLQVLQRLGLESSQGTGAVGSLPLVLRLLCLMQTSGPAENEMDGIHFKLLYHVSNLTGKLQASNTECLLPAFSYLYCCLRLSPPHCTDRAVSMLLCNAGLMDQLQATLDLSSSLSPPSDLLCCSRLLLSSLVTLQHTHSAQVHRSIRLNLGSTVQALVFGKRKTGSLLLASSLRLLQAVLDVDLESPVLCVSVGPGAGQRPLGDTDSSLHPLGSYGAHCLITTLYGLLLQKQELLLSVSVNCLGSLLRFLQRRSPSTAQHVVCQPWSRFLLYSLLNSGESCLLHPATLTLLTLLLRYGSRVVVWEPDLCQVLEAVEKRGLNELGENTTQALRQLLTQLQCSIFHPPPTEESRLRANTLMESLNSLPPTANDDLPTSILRVGEMYLCLSDFTVKTDGHNGSQL